MPAAFHLGKFPDEGLSAAVEVIHDGFALCIEAQAGFALAIGGNQRAALCITAKFDGRGPVRVISSHYRTASVMSGAPR